ncbi:MAG: isoprenylcysteine carboxylmethyltransferase family protein [Anaerolineaceae bacterium]|nr:MAG: isoprenylcysteine carboxylmethyltransferase family protein [Anaerolineaceae bacterium]
MKRENLVALCHALTGVAVMVISYYVKSDFLTPIDFLKPLGFAIFVLGMMFFTLSVASLRAAFLGNVEPVTETLITSGPYKYVRHPVYLGMVITVLGLSLGMKSLWGLICSILFFVPLGVYRAKLEEKAMAEAFGDEWNDYVGRTYFMFPPIY